MQNKEWLDSLRDLIECWTTDFEDLDKLLDNDSIGVDAINLIHEMQDNIVANNEIATGLYERQCVRMMFSEHNQIHVEDGDYHSWQ